jgi:preprotein translocase subunit SecE
MGSKQIAERSFDSIKWGLVGVLFVAGIITNYYFQDIAGALRAIAWIMLVGVILGIAALTTKGRILAGFSKEARIELRKVVWPSREETVKTTILVIILVLIMGFLMWLIDSLLFKLIQFLTGQ